jgi:uncharacterized protein YjeT (DUF2065 family)
VVQRPAEEASRGWLVPIRKLQTESFWSTSYEEQEHQKRLDVLERTVRDLPDRWRKEMAALRREMEGLSRELVRQLADARLRLRIVGLAYIVAGLLLAWLGNVL